MHPTKIGADRRQKNASRGITPHMTVEQRRKKELAAMHLMQKQLGMGEEDAQALKIEKTGHASAADMNAAQRKQYLAALDRALQARGLAQQRAAGKRVHHAPLHTSMSDPKEARWALCKRIWHTLWRSGLVHQDTDEALMAFAVRQTKTEWRWCNTHQINTVVEALKNWELRIQK
jgi:hypothetical protein